MFTKRRMFLQILKVLVNIFWNCSNFFFQFNHYFGLCDTCIILDFICTHTHMHMRMRMHTRTHRYIYVCKVYFTNIALYGTPWLPYDEMFHYDYMMTPCYYMMVLCHYIMILSYYMMILCHYMMILRYYMMKLCHYMMILRYYMMILCHYMMILRDYMMIPCHYMIHHMICHHWGADNSKLVHFSAKTACLFLILLFDKHWCDGSKE